ncbi:hypothetical protein [Crassaminicella profunda]|uniref:hypothetical protein n=1 Tax=Crassaminicella profunda TaxID=1286698 RepID=UPI001CA6E42C|nr:hypothetical protein [Crassaminicella profunda]QZY56620.1 hypothetical protein K7H06_06795 [Crassaminicella profunda]
MAITIYHDFQVFQDISGTLNKIDFENFFLPKEDIYSHYIKPYLVPNPFILNGIKFSSPCCLFTTYDMHKNHSLLFLEKNGLIDFPSITNGVILTFESLLNSLVKVTSISGETLTTTICKDHDPVLLGFISSNGIKRIEFIESPAFISSMLFTISS